VLFPKSLLLVCMACLNVVYDGHKESNVLWELLVLLRPLEANVLWELLVLLRLLEANVLWELLVLVLLLEANVLWELPVLVLLLEANVLGELLVPVLLLLLLKKSNARKQYRSRYCSSHGRNVCRD
jgi:hypothetical protein